jgi:hypothetical protein
MFDLFSAITIMKILKSFWTRVPFMFSTGPPKLCGWPYRARWKLPKDRKIFPTEQFRKVRSWNLSKSLICLTSKEAPCWYKLPTGRTRNMLQRTREKLSFHFWKTDNNCTDFASKTQNGHHDYERLGSSSSLDYFPNKVNGEPADHVINVNPEMMMKNEGGPFMCKAWCMYTDADR